MAVNIVRDIDDQVPVKTVLLSVSEKRGLELIVRGLMDACPGVRFLSTGGTFSRVADILGAEAESRLQQVSDYTGQPETQGGLVKTLDFKVYLGLLTETYNPSHQNDLARTGALPIDLVVVNLYPFQQTVSRFGASVEEGRANIDIGGPTMVRAAAKNWLRVGCVVDPADYGRVVSAVKERKGCTDLALRFDLARKAFSLTASYDTAISQYLRQVPMEAVMDLYTMRDR